MNQHRSGSNLSTIYHPFDHIPNELLALILVWASKGLERDHHRFSFPLLILRLVSQRWKEVAFATRALWVTLTVDKRLPVKVLESYLGKSGGLPLSLDIIHHGFLPILIHHAHRWERVTIWGKSSLELQDAIEIISPVATSLRHFSGILPHSYEYDIPTTIVGPLNPALEALHLTHVSLEQTPPLLFNNLTELVLRMGAGFWDPQGLLGMLEASSKLKILKIFAPMLSRREVDAWLLDATNHRAIELHDLDELVLSQCLITEFLFLTSLIGCPSLHSLGVGLFGMYDGFPIWTTALEALSPTYPCLQRLDLWTMPDDSYDLLLAVQNLPSIKTLGIRGGFTDCDGNPVDVVYTSPWFEALSHCCESIHTLQTRNIDASTLFILVRDWFPTTRTIFMYWKDVETAETEILAGCTKLDLQPQNIVSWGKQDEEIWHLEDLGDRRDRINLVLS